MPRSSALQAAVWSHGSWLEDATRQTPPWLLRGDNSPRCYRLGGSCEAWTGEKAALLLAEGVIHPYLSLRVLSLFLLGEGLISKQNLLTSVATPPTTLGAL